jgi:beta-galactosidase
MMSSLVTGWGKGVWCGPWESTGGPQQISGGKAPFWEEAQPLMPGSTVNAGVMTQLMLSYLAAGFRGFGFWCWNARAFGWEAGEYALLDRNQKVCERTVQVGRLGRAARRWRDELWECRREPVAGIFTDFDTDAMWAAASGPGREHYKHKPMKARVGASRALINHNIPWEYVTGRDLRHGLAGRYKVIYLPAVFSLSHELWGILKDYVQAGGRLVMDMPGAGLDEYGRLLPADEGSRFEEIFGCELVDFQFSRNVPWKLGERKLDGFVAELDATEARVLEIFANGKPAVTEMCCGEGTAVIMAFEASLSCFRPGDAEMEEMLAAYALGPIEPKFSCEGALCYRTAGPQADHYFLVNDGPATEALLRTDGYDYAGFIDAVSGEELLAGEPIFIPEYSGRWVRAEKA